MTAHADRPDSLADAAALDAWLAATPQVVARLEATPHPRIADVGSGSGRRVLGLARAFLDAWIDGFDDDPDRVARASRDAARAGLDGRVRFLHGAAGRLAAEGTYDLIVLCGDVPPDAEALRAIRTALRKGGTVLVGTRAVFADALSVGLARAELRCIAKPVHPLDG